MSQKTLNEITCDWCGWKDIVLPSDWKRIDIVRRRTSKEIAELMCKVAYLPYEDPCKFYEERIQQDICTICFDALEKLKKELKGV
jgi:hypothetical protein